MQASEAHRAIAAAISVVSERGLPVDDAIVLNDSNLLALRLRPCEVVARVGLVTYQASAAFEVELAQRLAEARCPVAVLDPRVEPRVFARDGFVMNLWTYYEPLSAEDVPSGAYASALEQLHAGMRTLDVATPHFMDRVADAQRVIERTDLTLPLAGPDRELLRSTLRRMRDVIASRDAPEQLLHGEPHPGNVLNAAGGPRFIDLETCCRGPVEFDLAHVPREVCERYPNVDRDLLADCRILVLAMVTAWRFDPGDQLPNGEQAAEALLSAIRNGPPWPTLDEVWPPEAARADEFEPDASSE